LRCNIKSKVEFNNEVGGYFSSKIAALGAIFSKPDYILVGKSLKCHKEAMTKG